MEIKGVIFDLDGVVFDTERLSIETWKRIEKEFNIKIDFNEVFRMMGANFPDLIGKYASLLGGEELARTIFAWRQNVVDETIIRDGLTPKPGFIELINHLNARGLDFALATSRFAAKLEFVFRHSSIGNPFKHIVTGDMVEKSKPDPEIYITAAGKMGLDIRDCMVIEDSWNGITGAIASGAKAVMAVDMYQPDETIIANCFAVVHSLHEVIDLLQSIQ